MIMSKTVKVAQTSDLLPGIGKVVQADGRNIAVLFNVEGTFFAIDNTCTHRGGPLGEGKLSSDTVECPWHGTEPLQRQDRGRHSRASAGRCAEFSGQSRRERRVR